MKILAIESSCDETSAAVVERYGETVNVVSNVTATSLQIHAATGGIIPENAAREQVKYILPVITDALLQNKKLKNKKEEWNLANSILKNDIDAIAITYGPGLIGSLLVGVETAKTLSFITNKPIIPVNHLLAHIYANYINRKEENIKFPFLGLIVSGGHTDLVLFKSHTEYQWLGGTRDDAAGEALDKTGRLLDLSYPAGPEIEKRARLVKEAKVKFKSPLLYEDTYDFSFSGLKTEVLRFVQSHQVIDTNLKNEICYAIQKAVVDVLVDKTLKAAKEFNCKNILIGGGVSANETFKENISKNAEKLELSANILFPEKKYSTDNAAMIGAYALLNGSEKNWKLVNANPELYFA